METKRERALKILKGLTHDLKEHSIMWNEETLHSELVRVLKARLENEVWNGIEMSGIPEIDEQVKSGLTYGKFGHYPGSKMGGKFWINNKNEVDYKHTTYFDVYDQADFED